MSVCLVSVLSADDFHTAADVLFGAADWAAPGKAYQQMVEPAISSGSVASSAGTDQRYPPACVPIPAGTGVLGGVPTSFAALYIIWFMHG